MKPALLAALAAAALAGCAYRPVIDTSRSDMTHYEKDLGECREFARKGGGAAGGALAGGVVGHVVGRAAGGEGRAGAALGAAGGAGAGAKNRRAIVRNCLIGRGYAVLN